MKFFYALFFISNLLAEIPHSSLERMPPMTEIYHPVSTANPEAQKSFDRGLTNTFAYNHDLAFAFFKKAAELDPDLAMAYWGMAIARGQNVNDDVTRENELKCYEYIQKAIDLAGTASQNERDYIAAAATRYTNDPDADLIPLRYRYREAMKKVTEAYPEDLDALTLYAESILMLDPWKWWTPQGKPRGGIWEAIDTIEHVLSRNPYHIGANHFDIHAWEESPFPERALMSAHRLLTLLPDSGHLLHMPNHIFLRVGDYETGLKTSKNAVAQGRAYFKKYGFSLGTYPLYYLSHDIYVMARAYMYMEDYENAIKTAQEAYDFVEPYLEQAPGRAHYARIPLEIYLYFHKWEEILQHPFASNMASALTFWHYSRAKAFAALGDLDSAKKDHKLMMEYKEKIPPEEVLANNPAVKIMDLAELDLEATFAASRGQTLKRIALLEKAVTLQDHLNYDEPPPWFLSMRIPLGSALLEEGRYKEAALAFQQTLKTLQRNGRALFGLFLSLKGQHREIDAFWIERQMTAALKHASFELTLQDL